MSIFHNPKRARQLISFEHLDFGGNRMFSDIDGAYDHENECYVLLELKYGDNPMTKGQGLLLTRMCDDLQKTKPTLFIVARHMAPEEEEVDAGFATVDRYRFDYEWHFATEYMTVAQLVTKFLKDKTP